MAQWSSSLRALSRRRAAGGHGKVLERFCRRNGSCALAESLCRSEARDRWRAARLPPPRTATIAPTGCCVPPTGRRRFEGVLAVDRRSASARPIPRKFSRISRCSWDSPEQRGPITGNPEGKERARRLRRRRPGERQGVLACLQVRWAVYLVGRTSCRSPRISLRSRRDAKSQATLLVPVELEIAARLAALDARLPISADPKPHRARTSFVRPQSSFLRPATSIGADSGVRFCPGNRRAQSAGCELLAWQEITHSLRGPAEAYRASPPDGSGIGQLL